MVESALQPLPNQRSKTNSDNDKRASLEYCASISKSTTRPSRNDKYKHGPVSYTVRARIDTCSELLGHSMCCHLTARARRIANVGDIKLVTKTT